MAALVTAKIPCTCGAIIDVKVQPTPRIVNCEFVSLIIMDHSGQMICPSCNQTVVPLIRGVDNIFVECQVVPVTKQNLVIPVGADIH